MSRRGPGTILYVSGFSTSTTAKSLAQRFEDFGELQRCDIPAPKTSTSRVYAFIEYVNPRDAEDAQRKMHNFQFDEDHILDVQWAKQPPSSIWRFDGPPSRRGPPPGSDRGGGRQRSPPPRGAPESVNDGRRADRGYPDAQSRDDRRAGDDKRGGDDRRTGGGYDDRRPDRRDDRRSGGYDSRRDDRPGYADSRRGAFGTDARRRPFADERDSRGGGSARENGFRDPPRDAPRGGYDSRDAPRDAPRGGRGYDDRR